jgi:hypothetical protein
MAAMTMIAPIRAYQWNRGIPVFCQGTFVEAMMNLTMEIPLLPRSWRGDTTISEVFVNLMLPRKGFWGSTFPDHPKEFHFFERETAVSNLPGPGSFHTSRLTVPPL